MGELSDFEKWLYTPHRPRFMAKSALSGKPVILTDPNYSRRAKFVNLDEISFASAPRSLDENSIKDIDSIIQASSEIFHYCGNIVLGECSNIEDSSTVVDSHFIYWSEVGFPLQVRGIYLQRHRGLSSAGTGLPAAISSVNTFLSNRCFEVTKAVYSSDCYYSQEFLAARSASFRSISSQKGTG